MMEWMRAGGILMWVLLALSVVAVTVVLERLLFYRRATTDPVLLEEAFGKAVCNHVLACSKLHLAWCLASCSSAWTCSGVLAILTGSCETPSDKGGEGVSSL